MPTSIFKVFALVRDYKLRFAISQLAMLVAAVCIVWYASLISELVDKGMVAGDQETAVNVGIWMLVLAIAMGLSIAIAGSQAVFFSQGAALYIRRELYNTVQGYSFENFDHRPTSDLMVRLNSDVVNIQNAVLYTILLGSLAPFLLLLTIAMAIINTPDLAWVVIVVIVAVLAVMAVLVPAIDRAYRQRQRALDDLNNTFQENLTGMSVVKAFVRERYEMRKFSDRAQVLRGPEYQAAWRVAFMAPMLTGLGQLAIVVAIWAGGNNVIDGAGLSVGDVSTFTQYMGLIITPLALLAQVMPLIMRGDVSAARIIEAYRTEATIRDPDDIVPILHDDVQGRIVFDDVSFAFRRADDTLDPPALKHINLTIEPGQQVGFLGADRSRQDRSGQPDSPLLRRHGRKRHDRRRRRPPDPTARPPQDRRRRAAGGGAVPGRTSPELEVRCSRRRGRGDVRRGASRRRLRVRHQPARRLELARSPAAATTSPADNVNGCRSRAR